MSFTRNRPLLADIYEAHERRNVFEDGKTPGKEICQANSRKTSSFNLPSIDSAYGDSESLSPVSNSYSHEDEKSISTSEFSLEDFDEFRNDEKLSSGTKAEEYMLTEKDMQEIEHRVQEKFREDFKKIWQDAKAKELKIKKKFTKVIDNAREMLVEARVNGEKEAVNKLEEKAEEKQNEIMKKRSLRRWQILNEKDQKIDIKHNSGAGSKWVREQMEEMASLRKIQSDLDRARARRKTSSGLVSLLNLKKKGKIKQLMQTEIRKLERIDEIQNLIQDLNRLGLSEQANSLHLSIQSKEQADFSLRIQLKEERSKARIEALKKKEEEVQKLRKKRIAEMERLEKERKAREERERRERVMAALARKAHNQALRRSFDQTLLNSRISKSHTFTYFSPPIRK
ncbi:hypothetical protein ACROYT_G007249 [Oculina patagonica]